MLASARKQYDEQVRITELAVRQSRRQANRGPRGLARLVATYQAEAVALSIASAPDVLTEQGIDPSTEGHIATTSLLTTPSRLAQMFESVESNAASDRIVAALVNDAGRTAALVDSGRRKAVTGYVRSLLPPSCGRCAVLAGRVYRFSTGFRRHPRCDCLMTPTDQTIGPYLVTDPSEAFDKGWIHGLTKAEREAVSQGADLARVVNVRRASAGLNVGSSVALRKGRLTPEGCAIYSTDQADFRRLLRKFGYLA